MSEKVSGFGYCTADGKHFGVDFFKTPENKYYAVMDYIHSHLFDNLDTESIWRAVGEIEDIRNNIMNIVKK